MVNATHMNLTACVMLIPGVFVLEEFRMMTIFKEYTLYTFGQPQLTL